MKILDCCVPGQWFRTSNVNVVKYAHNASRPPCESKDESPYVVSEAG